MRTIKINIYIAVMQMPIITKVVQHIWLYPIAVKVWRNIVPPRPIYLILTSIKKNAM